MSDEDDVETLESLGLTEEEYKAVKKCGDARMQMVLGRAGYDVDDTLNLKRDELMVVYGKYVVSKRMKKVEELSDRELKIRELGLREEELKFRREEAAAAELWRRRDAKKTDEELELKSKELDLEAKRQQTELERDNAIDRRIKRFGDALRYSMVEMSDEPGELPHFFTTIESLYDSFAVPDDIRSKLLLPLVSNRAKLLLSRLTTDQLADYATVRDFLLSEFKLTSSQYRDRFQTTHKQSSETFTLFCSKIKSLFTYYLKSRQVDDNFKSLVDLIVADRLKQELPSECLKHILAVEGDSTLSCDKIASAADIFMSTHFANGEPKIMPRSGMGLRGNGGQFRYNHPRAGVFQANHAFVAPPRGPVAHHAPRSTPRGPNPASVGGTGTKTCYRCGSNTHLSSWHYYKNPSNNNTVHVNAAQQQRFPTVSALHVKYNPSHVQIPVQPTYRTIHDDETIRLMDDLHHLERTECYGVDAQLTNVQCVDNNDDFDWLYNVNIGNDNCDDDGNIASCCANGTSDVMRVETALKRAANLPIQLSPMQYIMVTVDEFGVNSYKALVDSGAELCVLRDELIVGRDVTRLGKISLRGVVGDAVSAELVELHVRPSVQVSKSDVSDDLEERLENIGPPIPVIFAVCKMSTNHDIILSADVVQKLEELQAYNVLTVNTRRTTAAAAAAATAAAADTTTAAAAKSAESRPTVIVVADGTPAVPNHSSESEVNNYDSVSASRADCDTLIEEQKNDSSLAPWMLLGKDGKGNFFFRSGILYHKDTVCGQVVEQLCLPSCRVGAVLRMGHDAMYSGHYAFRNTWQRIRLSFIFPRMRNIINDYCSSCVDCQLRGREFVKDRVPITAIARNEVPFSHLWWDCIGPLFDPMEAKGRYNYCLVICDSATRYPFAFPLRSLTAAATCDALMQVFMIFGTASVISGDFGSNFRAELTRECLERLGCSPKFNEAPFHPSSSGLIERCNQSLKRCLHHVVRQYPRLWHKFVPYILWAMREVPNATTNSSPFLLAFGRPARGPLAILKENWAGEKELPLNMGKSVVQYLQELKHNLQVANDYATEHCNKAQNRYVSQYNLRSTERKFVVGQEVIVLMPDGGGRHILSRWQGPATIVEIRSPHSYIVEYHGKKRHLHVDKLRAYNARVANVHNCAMIYEQDDDFGEVVGAPSAFHTGSRLSDVLPPSQRIDRSLLSHLSDLQQTELLTLIDKFHMCFSETPGLCPVAVHEIRLVEGFKPKRFQAYRLPEALKAEVAHQIKELLELGFIKPSKSEMVSPMVCVLKGRDGTGGVRIAIDYRYVNKYTVGESCPIPAIDEVMHRVGKANYISTFDCKSSFWQIAVRPEDTWLTAFITDFGVFEWLRAPFGLKWSGNSLMRATQQVLLPLREFVDSYVDDIPVFTGGSWDLHVRHLTLFLQAIEKSQLTLNLKKCRFGLGEVNFVGHSMGSGMHGPDPEKIRAVDEIRTPKTKSDLRKILGFFSYFRSYIPDYAHIAQPLTELTTNRYNVLLPWGDVHSNALQLLKSKLCEATKLNVVEYNKPFGLAVDASKTAVGCCLFQWEDDGVTEKPIAFGSAKLAPNQQNWSAIEAEAYAAIWALKKYSNFVFSMPVTVFSDHNPLTYITEGATKSAKLTRWALALQQFNVSFKYRPAQRNRVADLMSRLCGS